LTIPPIIAVFVNECLRRAKRLNEIVYILLPRVPRFLIEPFFSLFFLVFSNVCGSAFIVGLFVLSVPNTNRLYLKLYAEFYFDIIVLQFHFINLAQASVIL